MATLTRERIVGAARVMVDAVGHEGLSARKLAAELGVTAPALYDHVRSLDEILAAVAAVGYEELAASYEVIEHPTAIERVRARAIAYVNFARTNPELFQLMFMYRPAAVALEADNELGAASDVFDSASEDVAAAIADGDLVNRPVDRIALTMWAGVHGVATIATRAPTVAESIVDEVVDALLAGLAPD